ncbi:hypothetical protein QJS10_CPA02g01116 [Acorus calamus]|uniref:Uncharacterized protein n=1 Tax=Acorus calamus TaxID=4465 RepID=A0AAV9FG38_ACOCL|nr:hypothetical protein QJS10_CPA02g01116 [Acorus calamus]
MALKDDFWIFSRSFNFNLCRIRVFYEIQDDLTKFEQWSIHRIYRPGRKPSNRSPYFRGTIDGRTVSYIPLMFGRA